MQECTDGRVHGQTGRSLNGWTDWVGTGWDGSGRDWTGRFGRDATDAWTDSRTVGRTNRLADGRASRTVEAAHATRGGRYNFRKAYHADRHDVEKKGCSAGKDSEINRAARFVAPTYKGYSVSIYMMHAYI